MRSQAQDSHVPVVAVVGKSDSGKTTLIESLVRELSARGFRVATAKHHACASEVDVPGKDSHRHAKAGAVVSLVISPEAFGLFAYPGGELALEEAASLAAVAAGGVDILVAEGFSRSAPVRIEVSRDARSRELVCAPDELMAVVSDGERETGDTPVFRFDEVGPLADLIVEKLLGGGD
ncbi:MAG: molybdopterin-guanine dinucleotide biosynthesis protein B [Coriobacteriia bacterium]